jgi:hypothetical protein
MMKLLGLVAALCLAAPASAATTLNVRDAWPASALGSVNPDVFEMALAAASCAQRAGAVDQPATLTVIDYSLPSTAKRMWVYDLRNQTLLYEELVSHGQGSGENMASRFSNVPNSYQTSLGLFVTAEPYVGKNGYSLRLDGLEAGVNDRARERAIVMHGAPYVSEEFVSSNGRLGRSQGCPAVRNDIARGLIDTVKGGGLVFAYAKDPAWLRSSAYLGQCAAAQLTSSTKTLR